MKVAVLICRVLLGVGFLIFGSNILHPFLPMPPPEPGSSTAQFMAVMWPTHWMALVGLFQVIGGLCVLSGRLAPLGLALLAPILVNVLAFHTLIEDGQGIAPGLVFSALEVFLVYAYWNHFRSLFSTVAKHR